MGSNLIPLILLIIGVSTMITTTNCWSESRFRRSIDLTATNSLIPDARLPTDVVPNNYTLDLRTNLDESTFKGHVKIFATCLKSTNQIQLHAHDDLTIAENEIVVREHKSTQEKKENAVQPTDVKIRRIDKLFKKPILVIYLQEVLEVGLIYEIDVSFSGRIGNEEGGIFSGKYTDNKVEKKYIATSFRPHNARSVFPCFDEPSYKVPFIFTLSRPKQFHTLFNTPVEKSTADKESTEYMVDHFAVTPAMSTFTFGFVISELKLVSRTSAVGDNQKPQIKVWARDEVHENLAVVYDKVAKIVKSMENYWGLDFPLSKLDIVAIPAFPPVKSADNWGLIVFKESELQAQGYKTIAQEISYQWLGSWVTPFWWSDAHINKAIAGFLSTLAAIEIDHGKEFDGKWPMTELYMLYYEFSKRYPHSRITGMKQENICSKTELVLRMLNYTLGYDTFKRGMQKFITDREYKTFYSEDVWEALTKQAHLDDKLCETASIADIAESWITKNRFPVVRVERHYENKSATVTQRVYLRERPHDVPERDKMLWWIPLVLIGEDNLDFDNTKPFKWMKKTKELTLNDLPAADKFIIVNPEEIGPFPVNYDEKNWNLLSAFLQTEEGRSKIPVYTRAKLLHDAWNLAYAGDLNFATAFNMTLFIKDERNHLVWNGVFTFIDHIGRHIDMSVDVHRKFEIYVRNLLTPFYEELTAENNENWKTDLISLAKAFLCRAGYKPCIEEAQKVYKKWMDSEDPDLGNPVANQYICPVFKWGTQEEWEFGLQRIINFPESRQESERTYLLKSLAGCPIQSEKIYKLLNLTVLENNGNFTDKDITTIFRMLSGASSGYTTLFHFLQNNFDTIKVRFENRENLWDILISASTGAFTTQEGYDMVSQLYVRRHGEFGTAEHIIEKSLKNIKEETKWSDENLPVIEKWLDNYLKNINTVDEKFME
uniref:Aminopeptidase n=1 Tax=Corethrella appendiculata TaxID=1370023 RepID=U5EY25_9DIPT